MEPQLPVVQLDKICSEEQKQNILPIRYACDWIKDFAPYVQPFDLKLNEYMDSPHVVGLNIPGSEETYNQLIQNSFKLDPKAANLPWLTSIKHLRQNIHWQAAVEGYNNFLVAFMEDEAAQRIPHPDSMTIADMAKKELKRLVDGSSRFVTYMYPFASARLVKLLAEMQSLSLLFDESWEIHEHEHNENFFKSLMPPQNHAELNPKTPLQQTVWESIAAVYEEDRISGSDGGRGLVQVLTDYITHPLPRTYKTFGDFMDYRFWDGGMVICWNSAKLTVGSNISLEDPKIARFVRLFSDQMLQSNDISSYDKEKKYWQQGKAKRFLDTNGVVVISQLMSLRDEDAAKAIAYAAQMEKEREIDNELSAALSGLTPKEWRLICAMMYCIPGNMMAAVTMRRYGGSQSKFSE